MCYHNLIGAFILGILMDKRSALLDVAAGCRQAAEQQNISHDG